MTKEPLGKLTFNKDGKEIKIVDYFRTQYKIDIRHQLLPGVEVRGRTKEDKLIIPMELCTLAENQILEKQCTPGQIQKMIKFTTKKPAERAKQIQNIVSQNLKWAQDPYLRAFGIKASQAHMAPPQPRLFKMAPKIAPFLAPISNPG